MWSGSADEAIPGF